MVIRSEITTELSRHCPEKTSSIRPHAGAVQSFRPVLTPEKKQIKDLHTHFTDITTFGNVLALKNLQVHPQWQFTFMETDHNNSVVH